MTEGYIRCRRHHCCSLYYHFHQWVLDGTDYNVWNLSPLKADIENIISSGEYDYLLLDYPFAYRNDLIRDYIDCAVFIDTPLDIAMARRILRDMNNASADEIRDEMKTYLKDARIAYVQMLKDIKPSSDYVVDGTQNLKTITEELLDIIVRRGEKP